jgi:predicted ATP-dependent endonuclease of OLD family
MRNGTTELRSIDPEEVDVELKDLGYSKSGLLQSEAAVFVEGISDKLILTEWANTLDLNVDEEGVTIVEVEGEGNVGTHGRSLVKVLQSFEIPYLFILDSDENDPNDVIREYKRKINRENDSVDQDKVWWYTTPEKFAAWSNSDIEYFLLNAPTAIADVLDEDVGVIKSIIEDSTSTENVEILRDIWSECHSDPSGITSYEKDVHGRMIAKKMDENMIDDEIVRVVDDIRNLI